MSEDYESEAAQCFADTLITCVMLGVPNKQAAEFVVATFFQNGKLIRIKAPKDNRLPWKQWKPLRDAILARDGYMCTYCGDDTSEMVADHVIPISRGGSNEEDNLACACVPCNSSKRDKRLSEWRGRYQ